MFINLDGKLFIIIFQVVIAIVASSSFGVHFVRVPKSVFVAENKNDEVVFDCKVNLMPDSFEWKYRLQDQQGDSEGSLFKTVPHNIPGINISYGELTTQLRVRGNLDLLGEYRCVGWFGPVALTSVSARLLLAAISLDDADKSKGIELKSTWRVSSKNALLLRCGGIVSQPPAIWSFYRNGIKLKTGSNETLGISDALALNSVTLADSGLYTCSAMNPISGEIIMSPRSIDIIVNDDYANKKSPVFLDLNSSTKIVARMGDPIVLECSGVGTPVPKITWSTPNDDKILASGAAKMFVYGLKISNASDEYAGIYICRVDNEVKPQLVRRFELIVHEPPKIMNRPNSLLANESDKIELECTAKGIPQPNIYWLINGMNIGMDIETMRNKQRLVIKHVQKRHAGIIQCFAQNYLGEDSAGMILQVNPKQIQENDVRERSKHNKKRKNSKKMQMVPPSSPNVTRLSDTSVMLRWQIKNEGLPIQFFKVQYLNLSDSSHQDNWQTTNEVISISLGKRNRNDMNGKSFTSSVTGLTPGHFYRFRIVAVYSNNDNKESNTSNEFCLQRGSSLGLSKSSLMVPVLVDIKPYSEKAIILYWTLNTTQNDEIEGFYAYYRPASSAGEYFKSTIEGSRLRKFKIGMLEPDTIYEFKLQSFNSLSASQFSSIKQGRTLKLIPIKSTSPPLTSTIPKKNETNETDIFTTGAICGISLLLVTFLTVCCCRRKRIDLKSRKENEPQLRSDNQLPEGFSNLNGKTYAQSNTCKGSSSIKLSPHITVNPMAQLSESASLTNELKYFQTSTIGDQNYSLTESSFSFLSKNVPVYRSPHPRLELENKKQLTNYDDQD